MARIEGGGEHPPGTVPTTGANAAGRAVDDHAGDPHRGKDWDPEAMAPFGPKPVPEHRWFESKSLVARLFILLAGVTMNVLLAYVINAGSVVARGRPYIPAVIDSAVAGRPAALAGLTRGDSVVAVNGEAVRTWSQVVERVAPVTNGTVTLRVVRAGTPRDVTLSPKPEQAQDPVTGTPKTVGRIGVLPRAVEARERLSLGGALAEGARETAFAATSVVRVLRGLFGGDVAVSNLGGPIAIARTSVQAARLGFEPLLRLISFLSVNIAVLNLLPIPVLDGGQVVINLLEAAKGSAFSLRTREYILRAGVAAVALLFVTVMWNDLARLAGDLFR
jgi:regulator of sigma E protease